MNSWCESTTAPPMPGKCFRQRPRRCSRATSLASRALVVDLTDVAGISALDPADIGIVGVVIDVDHGREIIVDAELPHLGKTRHQDFSFLIRVEKIEFLRAWQRRKPAVLLQPPHQPALLIDEHHRPGRQLRDLAAEPPHLLRGLDIVIVFLRLAGIIEQDDAAEAVTAGELLQPRGKDFAEEAKDEEFADLHCPALSPDLAKPS